MVDVRYYLGVPVEVIEVLGDGWAWARWPDGRVFKHWTAQLEETPWGDG